MKLEQNDKSLLFSSTDIPDVFFTEYLSLADGNYVKVYLYLLFLSSFLKRKHPQHNRRYVHNLVGLLRPFFVIK